MHVCSIDAAAQSAVVLHLVYFNAILLVYGPSAEWYPARRVFKRPFHATISTENPRRWGQRFHWQVVHSGLPIAQTGAEPPQFSQGAGPLRPRGTRVRRRNRNDKGGVYFRVLRTGTGVSGWRGGARP